MYRNRQSKFIRRGWKMFAAILCLAEVHGGGQAGEVPRPVHIAVHSATQPAIPVRGAVSLLTGDAGTLLAGNSARALVPGRYRLRAELALTPLGDTQTALRHYILQAGGTQRVLNSLHFRDDARFEEFTLDFDVSEHQRVPVGIRWQRRPGNEIRKTINADTLNKVPLTPPVPDISATAIPDLFEEETMNQALGRLMVRTCHLEQISPLMTVITTDKMVYGPGEQGTGCVTLENPGGSPASVALRILLLHGLDGQQILHTESLEVPARSRVVRTVSFDTGNLYWGCELRAQVSGGQGSGLDVSTVFCVASNIWEVATIAGHGPDYGYAWKDPERADGQVAAWREAGFTGFELYFWPPCGFSDFTPDHENFISGQMQYRHSISGTRNLIAAAKAKGLSASLYSNLWCVDGYAGYTLMRRQPEWFESDFFDAAAMEQWRLAERGDIPSPRSWFRAEIKRDPEITEAAMAHHATEILDTYETFGWDAIRYDTYISSPWTIKATRLVRERVEDKVPSFQFGYNTFPLADEANGALAGMVTGGGMTMLEYVRFEQFATLSGILDELLAVREAVWRHGGHIGPLYRPPEPGSSAEPDAVWLSSIILASGGHPYYAPLENNVGEHQVFALRYSEFLWNNRMRPLDDAAARIVFGNGLSPLRWQKLARILDCGAQRRRMVVHILNTDEKYRHSNNLSATPPPLLRDVPVMIHMPDSARIEGAWHLTAVPEARHESLPFTRKDSHVQVLIPEVRFWSVLVIDYTEAGIP